ncbi:MAG: metallophosphoesterase, partial [Pseudomonadales bacterium]
MEPHPPFRFAHLSDPHLTSPESVRLGRLMGKRLIGYISWRTRRRYLHRREMLDLVVDDSRAFAPHHTVITGDLTHLGLATEFDQAHAWLQSLGSGRDVTVVPGNHDIYAEDSRHRVKYWSDYASGDDRARADFPFVRVRGPVAFVGVNSGDVSPPFFATGFVGSEQLEALEKILEDLAQRNLCRVVLVHHSPVEGEERWRKRLVDASEVAAVLARQGAELVLHGHGHRVRLSSLGAQESGILGAQESGIPVLSAAS